MPDATPTTNNAPSDADIIASMGAPEPGEIRNPPLVPEAREPETEQPEVVAEQPQEVEQVEEPQEPDPNDEPPEFWSAERKAHWERLKDFPELRQAIRGHYEEANRATSKRLEEAANKAKAAEEAAKAALTHQEQAVAWWQQFGPQLDQIMLGRYANIDWKKLREENPGEFVRLEGEFKEHQAFIQAVGARHRQYQAEAKKRADEALMQSRQAEHGKLAAKFPKEFGSTEAAQATYGKLSKYLADQGIPAERISDVYEAPVVEIVRKAYMYDQLQAKAKEVTNPKPPATPASQTPMRVVPGPGRKPGNQVSDHQRQAEERLRNGERLSEEDLRWAFR